MARHPNPEAEDSDPYPSSTLSFGITDFSYSVSYFGPDNFCCESGAGVYYGPSMSGSPFNAFRLIFASPGADPTYVAFGGGDYSLWAYK
jgi:hypothetical protein